MKIDLLYKGIIGILKDMKKLISIILSALLLGTALFAEIPDEEITTMNFNPDQISKLDINFAAGNVKVQAVKTNEITVTVTREYDAPAATTKIEKGTLSIKTKLFSNYKKKIDVLVEIPFGKEFEEIKTTCVSANSTIKNIDSKNITITSGGGKVKIENCNVSDHLKISGAGGQLSVEDSKVFYLTVSSVGGTTYIDDVTTSLVRTESANGNIILKNMKAKAFESQSASGSFEAQFETMPVKASWVKTSSGNIDLVFPKGAGYKAIINSLNGQFIDNNTSVTAASCEDLISQFKNGEVEIKLSTKSGKATITSE